MTEQETRIGIIAVGNEMRRDDGAGIIAGRALAHEPLPDSVSVLDGVRGGVELLAEVEGLECVVILRAAEMGAAPGTVLVRSLAEFEEEQGTADASSMPLSDLFELAGLAGAAPEVHVVAVQPAEIAPGSGLSLEVGRAIARMVADAKALAERLAVR